MAATINFSTQTVPQLRQFLSERGITCNEYRKLKLVRLAEVACELKLKKISPKDDYKDMLTKRRTIKLLDGSSAVAPELDQVNWSTDLKHLPFTEMADLLIYFLRTAEWSDNRLKNYRQDNGYKLFRDRHINNVKLCKIPNSDYVYVVATCVRETNLSENPYTTWLILHTDGQIFSTGCSCVADDGTCKHCTALLFAIADFSDRHSDRNTVTDKAPYWDDEDNHDAYLERMKAEGKERQSGDEDDDSDSSDESYNPNESASDVAEEYDSNHTTSSDGSSDYDSNPPTLSDGSSDYSSDSGDSNDEKEQRWKQREEKRAKEKKRSRTAKTRRERLPGSERKKKKSKSKKDPNAPKRPQSAYFLWINANREEMKKENPEMSITDLSKKAGELWKQLENKTEWKEKAVEAKIAYEKAMEKYRSNAALKEGGSSDDDEESTKKRKSPKKSPSKSVSDSRAGARSILTIFSSSEDSPWSDSDDRPLKKKAKKENNGSESESSVGATRAPR